MKRVLIIGSGFSGATCARILAENGFQVTILDKRESVGGNCVEETLDNEVRVHKYGPHVFHTNIKEVWEFISRFSDFYKHEHKVLGQLTDNVLIPIPANLNFIRDILHDYDFTSFSSLLGRKRTCNELLQNEHTKELASALYSYIYKPYSEKQWGAYFDEIDMSILDRIPFYFSSEDRYFTDEFQYMPCGGFNVLFNKMLNHHNIKVILNLNGADFVRNFNSTIIYTGSIDEIYHFEYGVLPYRSVEIVNIQLNEHFHQCVSVINYPGKEYAYTRVTEYKHITKQDIKNKTAISTEFPRNGSSRYGDNEPMYPIPSEKAISMYNDYKNRLNKDLPNVIPLGRLGEYKYINMDQAIYGAITLCDRILKKEL